MGKPFSLELIERYEKNIPIVAAEIARLEREMLSHRSTSRRVPEIEAKIAEHRNKRLTMQHAIAYVEKKNRAAARKASIVALPARSSS